MGKNERNWFNQILEHRSSPTLWPKSQVIAVTLGVALESFVGHSQFRRGTPLPDYVSCAFGEYGARAGIRRIFGLMQQLNIPGTIYVNGLAASRHPDVVRTLAEAGHELVGHGWANDQHLDSLSEPEERAVIGRTLSTIETVSGIRPVGWVSPGYRITANTIGILEEEGIQWLGDFSCDDFPFHIEVEGSPIVIKPALLEFANDLSLVISPKNPPEVLFQYFKASFDRAYQEGLQGSPKVVDLVVHSHFSGRPMLIDVIEQCLKYAMGFPDVWFCTGKDIAQQYLSTQMAQ